METFQMRELADDIQTDECKTALDCKGPLELSSTFVLGLKRLF